MSTLTKVFVILVSVLAIFLCGTVVTFVAKTEDYKSAYEEQVAVATAAQVQALAAEDIMKRVVARYDLLNQRLQENIALLESDKSQLVQEYTVARQAMAQAEGKSAAAVNTMQSLQATVQNMYSTQNAIQSELNKAQGGMLAAHAQVIDMTRQLNGLQVERDQLISIRKRNEEKIFGLENQISQVSQKLQEVRISSHPVETTTDKVTSVTPAEAGGVPIRGEIREIHNNLASISVGSSSGVREDMRFVVVRGGKYLGDLVVTFVEPTAAAGRLERQQGNIVAGDRVTTGFD